MQGSSLIKTWNFCVFELLVDELFTINTMFVIRVHFTLVYDKDKDIIFLFLDVATPSIFKNISRIS